MSTPPVRAATAEAYQLAEGPVWDPRRQRLLWVDIQGGAVVQGVLTDGRIDVGPRLVFESTVGAVLPAADGRLVVATHDRLTVVGTDGTRTAGPPVVTAGRRFNDATTDPAGRLLVGTMALAGGSETEELARLEADGTVTHLDRDLTLSNGLAFSADGTRFFNADTERRTVFVRDYDVAGGAVGPRRVHLHLPDGWPDGLATDAEDHLWIALWGAGEVRRYAPDGTLVERVPVPAPHTTSVAFAGDDLRTLVITTATDGLTAEQLRAHPDSGRLFTTTVDGPGRPVDYWAPPTGWPPTGWPPT